MKILFRADASLVAGAGHVMRCLTLAQALRERGGAGAFVCRAHPGHLEAVIAAQGFPCHLLPVESEGGILGGPVAADAEATAAAARAFGADRVVVDHYGADAAWEKRMPVPVMVIDDLTDRPHGGDILLNQNMGAAAADYADLVPAGTTTLMGPEYAVLRAEFARLRPQALAARRDRPLSEILISLGGTDLPNATGWILTALAAMALPDGLHLTVVMGPTAPHLEDVRSRARALPCAVTVLAGTSEMGALMARADLAIGAGGSTSWERCVLGLPTLIVVLAENQAGIAEALARTGAARVCPLGETRILQSALGALVAAPDELAWMQARAARVCDGEGTARVMAVLERRTMPGGAP